MADDLTVASIATEKQAEALAEAGFESVEAIADAEPESLTSAEGIGEATAVKLIEKARTALGRSGDAPDEEAPAEETQGPEEAKEAAPAKPAKADKPAKSAKETSAPLRGLAVARMVHFSLPNCEGPSPAIVTRVRDEESGRVSLVVFCHPSHSIRGDQPLRFIDSAHFSDQDPLPTGSWGWPPRV